MSQRPGASPFDGAVFRSPKERAIEGLLALCALLSVATTVGITAVLIWESLAFFREVSLAEVFGGTRWTPQFAEKHFGIWPLVAGTFQITVLAAVVALPLGLAAAIYVSEFASERARRWIKPGLELLAGVPTVVYGYFALTVVTPLLQRVIPGLSIYNALSAGLVVGLMILPLVASLSEDALRAVPRRLALGAYALGATKGEVVAGVVVPSALSGIVASFILAISRAVGETMIVTLAAGATARFSLNPLEAIQTMTAYIVQISMGDTERGSIVYSSIFAVGLLLFLLTLGLNLLANAFVRRYRQAA